MYVTLLLMHVTLSYSWLQWCITHDCNSVLLVSVTLYCVFTPEVHVSRLPLRTFVNKHLCRTQTPLQCCVNKTRYCPRVWCVLVWWRTTIRGLYSSRHRCVRDDYIWWSQDGGGGRGRDDGPRATTEQSHSRHVHATDWKLRRRQHLGSHPNLTIYHLPDHYVLTMVSSAGLLFGEVLCYIGTNQLEHFHVTARWADGLVRALPPTSSRQFSILRI